MQIALRRLMIDTSIYYKDKVQTIEWLFQGCRLLPIHRRVQTKQVGWRGIVRVARKKEMFAGITGRGSREAQVSLLVTISARLCSRSTAKLHGLSKLDRPPPAFLRPDGGLVSLNNWTTPLFPPWRASVDREKVLDSRLLCRHVCIDKRRD